MIPLLAEATLKGSLLLLVAGAVTLTLHRSSAAVRHAVWTVAILGVLLVAPLALVLPALRVPSPGVVAVALEGFSSSGQIAEGTAPVASEPAGQRLFHSDYLEGQHLSHRPGGRKGCAALL